MPRLKTSAGLPLCTHCLGILWHEKLPQACRIRLADKLFNADTYNDLFTLADQVWEENGGVASNAEPTVVAAASAASPNNTTDAQVAAFARGRGRGQQRGRGANGRGRGNRGNGGNGRDNNSSNNQNTTSNSNANSAGFVNKGPRHADLPPPTCCSEHWKRGSGATFCYSPLDCPWKDRIVPRQSVTKNTNYMTLEVRRN